MMKKLYALIVMMAVVLCTASVSAQAESPLDFVKRYVQTANNDMAAETFSKMWRAKAQKHIHDTPERLEKEYQASVKMHELFLSHGSLDGEPQVNAWGDDEQTTSFTFDLERSISGAMIQEHFGYGADQIWSQYQITLENESGNWVVSGESFIGTPAE
jgi:hypothetical protein